MKIYNKLAVTAFCTLILAGCDLDKFPESGTVTEDQKKDVVDGRPEMLEADVNGLYSGMIQYNMLGKSSPNHSDFGYPATCLMLESNGQDMVASTAGYNWFSAPMLYTDRIHTSDETLYLWKTFYNHIKTANDVLSVVPADTDDAKLKVYRGQALTARAFDYLYLVQLFQFTYKGHEDSPAVPIVTETMTTEQAKSNPRATVKAVYELIMSDLNEAVNLLEGYARASKDQIDQHVAYGLRARANLLMQNWKDAASDAQQAMSGFSPYTLAEVSKPSFNDAAASSWIWGNIITVNNDVVLTGIINWPSHVCSMTGNGYTTLTGTWRYINQNFWEKIPASDIRKNWWVDENLKSKLTDNLVVESESAAKYFNWEPYVNVKFGAYQDIPDNTTNASDWPIMRVEEMILIQAEGLAMSGNVAQAKSVLEAFIKEYRNPDYVCTASSPEAMQDEIWFQRRIELWGEGFSFLDLMRLKKPLVRIENNVTNYPVRARFNMPAESDIFLYRIPESEIQVNDGINIEDNNKIVEPPVGK